MRVDQIAEHVDAESVRLCRKLDSGQHTESQGLALTCSFSPSFSAVMIGERKGVHTGCRDGTDELSWTVGAVAHAGVQVQIGQHGSILACPQPSCSWAAYGQSVGFLFRAVITVVALGAATILTWPQAFGLQTAPIIGQLVAVRALVALGAVAAVVVLSILRFVPGLRKLTGALAFVLVLLAIANAGILAWRGFSGTAITASATSITVLEWNTQGENVSASDIAKLAIAEHADVIALPETTQALGEAVALAMKAAGSPMWSSTVSFDAEYKSLNTTILLSPALGDYTVTSYSGSGPPLNTNTVPTVIAEPVDGSGPTIVAVHAVAPRDGQMGNWRSDLSWLAEQCRGDDVIMAGDFNSTVDNMAGLGTNGGSLGNCADAALAAKGAALGTWPTNLPAQLGAPIDHVLATRNYEVTGFVVPSEFDGAGSDHRPLITQLHLKG